MEVSKGYTDGFNAGFKLQRYQPEVFELLQSSLSEGNDWQKGIIEGAAQARKEKEQQRMSELQTLQNERGKERQADKER